MGGAGQDLWKKKRFVESTTINKGETLIPTSWRCPEGAFSRRHGHVRNKHVTVKFLATSLRFIREARSVMSLSGIFCSVWYFVSDCCAHRDLTSMHRAPSTYPHFRISPSDCFLSGGGDGENTISYNDSSMGTAKHPQTLSEFQNSRYGIPRARLVSVTRIWTAHQYVGEGRRSITDSCAPIKDRRNVLDLPVRKV